MKWESGRQNSGYEKLKFFSFWCVDAYLLRYREGASIGPHRDPVKDKRHFRLNVYLYNAESGGVPNHAFTIFHNRFATLFRPDLATHSVTPIVKGSRYVLSFGLALKEKK